MNPPSDEMEADDVMGALAFDSSDQRYTVPFEDVLLGTSIQDNSTTWWKHALRCAEYMY